MTETCPWTGRLRSVRMVVGPCAMETEQMTRKFSQCVEGRRGCPWARGGLEATRGFAGDQPGNGEERHRASARIDARQSVRNGATGISPLG